jgi:hypothetical protein
MEVQEEREHLLEVISLQVMDESMAFMALRSAWKLKL